MVTGVETAIDIAGCQQKGCARSGVLEIFGSGRIRNGGHSGLLEPRPAKTLCQSNSFANSRNFQPLYANLKQTLIFPIFKKAKLTRRLL